IVWPTISGMTVERRDQVLMTFFSPPRFMISTFSRRETSTNGPFFSDLDIVVRSVLNSPDPVCFSHCAWGPTPKRFRSPLTERRLSTGYSQSGTPYLGRL